MLYVGLDYHVNSSSVCILDERGQRIKWIDVRGRWPKVIEVIRGLGLAPSELAVAFEASSGYGMLYEQLCRVASRVEVGHPGSLRIIYKAKKKNDRLDAEKLAKLLYLDAMPQVHVPAAGVRQWRRLVEFRRSLVQRRVASKNQIRALMNNLGIEPARRLLQSRKDLASLSAQAIGDDRSALERDLLVEQLRQETERIKRVQRELNRIGTGDPRVTLLQTTPGVGPRTAEAFCAYVDRVQRFGRNNKIGSYFGLVPCQDASAEKNRLGHITKDGPASVRQLLVEAAWMAVRTDEGLKARFERLCNGRSERRKIAIVAIAHHLACAMGAMLRTNSPWRSSASASPSAVKAA
jgi:transposase